MTQDIHIKESIKELLIYSLHKRSLLLELFTILGTVNALKFISYFGGTKIEIPSKYDIQRQIKQIYMYQLSKEMNKSRYEIAKMFGTSEIEVNSCIKTIEKLKSTMDEEKTMPIQHQDVSIDELENFITSLEGEDYRDR